MLSISYQASAYTIHDAIISAHENNYDLLGDYEELQKQKLTKPQALTGFLPSVTAQGNFSKNTITSSEAKQALQKSNALNPNSAQRSLIVKQPLYNGGGTLIGIKMADAAVDGANFAFKDSSNQISLDTIKAYEQLLTNRNIYELNIKNEKAFLEHYRFAQIRFKHGEVTKTDVLFAEAKYSDAVAAKEKAQGDIRGAEATFERLIGQGLPPAMDEIKVDDVALPKNLDEFISAALKNHPGLLATRYNADVAGYKVTQTTSTMLPSVSAQAQLNRSDNPKATSISSPDSNTYSINVQVPIVGWSTSGGTSYLDVKSSQYDAQKAKYKFQETERQVKEAAITAWSNYKSSSAIIKSKKDGVRAAQEALLGFMEEYKVGTKTTIDVLDAENQLFQIKVSLRTAERDYIISIYTILQLMGYIDAVDVGDLNPKVS